MRQNAKQHSCYKHNADISKILFHKFMCKGTIYNLYHLQVNDIQRPGQYEHAVKSKESAREEIEVIQ